MCLRRWSSKIEPVIPTANTEDIDVFVFTPETVAEYYAYIREKYTTDLVKIFYSGVPSRLTMDDHLRFMAYKNTIFELIEKMDEPILENKYRTDFETLESIYKLRLAENKLSGTIEIDKEIFRDLDLFQE